jgi:hypothetical protein
LLLYYKKKANRQSFWQGYKHKKRASHNRSS